MICVCSILRCWIAWYVRFAQPAELVEPSLEQRVLCLALYEWFSPASWAASVAQLVEPSLEHRVLCLALYEWFIPARTLKPDKSAPCTASAFDTPHTTGNYCTDAQYTHGVAYMAGGGLINDSCTCCGGELRCCYYRTKRMGLFSRYAGLCGFWLLSVLRY